MPLPSILILDDKETDRYILKRELRAIDYSGHIFETSNGQLAIDFLSDFDAKVSTHGENFPPSCIFVDINMPIMDGYEFIDAFIEIKKKSEHFASYEAISLIMFSTSDRMDEINKALEYEEVIQYLIKGSYSLDELRQKIDFLFPKKY